MRLKKKNRDKAYWTRKYNRWISFTTGMAALAIMTYVGSKNISQTRDVIAIGLLSLVVALYSRSKAKKMD
ncbi:MAG: hypothetical protein PEPC_01044 [Peptostreptococcus russellii]|uniref:Uncharacterized protein n=1 Tax=Peptostreptococcus russellii TaxID=215200 RepID=A0A2P7PZR0_9FIRM|nr:hypothetical protein [Peptostreptococcus russellii]PSJ31214.1 hypothetical protein UF10_06115 [Peptostreptococcus russellii]